MATDAPNSSYIKQLQEILPEKPQIYSFKKHFLASVSSGKNAFTNVRFAAPGSSVSNQLAGDCATGALIRPYVINFTAILLPSGLHA